MHRLTQKCQYAVRTLLELCLRQGGGPVSVRDIAAAQRIPARYLEAIVADLRREGIVHSQRGPQGGYTLAVDPTDITVGQIIRLFDGDFCPVECVRCGGEDDCDLTENCHLAPLWKLSQLALSRLLDNTTFADVCRREFPAAVMVLPENVA